MLVDQTMAGIISLFWRCVDKMFMNQVKIRCGGVPRSGRSCHHLGEPSQRVAAGAEVVPWRDHGRYADERAARGGDSHPRW
jgi:hypothetical protein